MFFFLAKYIWIEVNLIVKSIRCCQLNHRTHLDEIVGLTTRRTYMGRVVAGALRTSSDLHNSQLTC